MKKSLIKISFILVSIFSNFAYCGNSLESKETKENENSVMTEEELTKMFENMTEDERDAARFLLEMPEEDREKLSNFFELDWKQTGTYKLSASNSTISLPEGYNLVVGSNANKALTIFGEPAREHLEALAVDEDYENTIIFEYIDCGHISLDDWSDLNSTQLLNSIIENTKTANLKRKKNGAKELHVIGWIQEPTLDKHNNTVYWAIEILEEGSEDTIVNSIALRLGREGFNSLIWVTSKKSYVPFGSHLDIMLRAHSFDPGFRYKDYTTGDKVAGYGIATLVAATVGGKIVKAGGFMILFKKLGGFIFAAIAAVFYKMKNIFKGKRD